MAQKAQRNLSMGELTPNLYASTDLDQYLSGLRTCRNYFVNRFGGVTNRSGTQYIAQTTGETRLIPYINNTVSLLLVLTDQKLNVYRNDVRVGVELDTPYDLSVSGFSLQDINYEQIGNTIVMVHRDHPPMEFEINESDNTSTFEAFSLTPETTTPMGLTLTSTATTSTDASATTFTYWVTAVDKVTLEESLPQSTPVSNSYSITETGLSRTTHHTIHWQEVSNAIQYNIYRSTSNNNIGFFYAVVDASNTDTFTVGGNPVIRVFFRDYGLAYQTTEFSYPERVEPFPTTTSSTSNNPGVVSSYQQRLVLASTNSDPGAFAFSNTALIHNYTETTPIEPSNSIKSRIVDESRIQGFAGSDRVIMFTSKGEFIIDGDRAGILSPQNINIRPISNWGTSSVSPIVIGTFIFYVQSLGVFIRSVNTRHLYTSTLINRYSTHLFENRSIKDWAYAETPHSILWIINDRGELISITYAVDENIIGTSRHDFEGGTVESITTITQDNEDVVYFIINRSGTRSIEKLTSRTKEDSDDYTFIDSHLQVGDRTLLNQTLQIVNNSITPDSWGAGVELTLDVPFTVSDYDSDTTHNGLLLVGSVISFTHNDVTYNLTVSRLDSNLETGDFHVLTDREIPRGLRSTSQNIETFNTDITISHVNFKGLEHLNGKEVSVYADSSVISSPNNRNYPTYRVTNGRLSQNLPRPASKVVIGLPYTYDIQTLDIDTRGITSTHDQNKLIKEVGIYVKDTRGLFTDTDFPENDSISSMTEFRVSPRGVVDSVLKNRTETKYKQIKISPKWDNNGRVAVRGVDPLPSTILAIYPIGYIPRLPARTIQDERGLQEGQHFRGNQ